uniref:Uncharacterized protein n=1 Tax=Bos indicus x Bos taurus TaxID=30522 RepID=A0A4W2DR58_BOBOX
MLCEPSCYECSLYPQVYCIHVLHVGTPINSVSGFWSFPLKYSWSSCELIFLVCSSVSDSRIAKMFDQVCFDKCPRQPCVTLCE